MSKGIFGGTAFLIIVLTFNCLTAGAQTGILDDFKPVCDSIAVLLHDRTSVEGKLEARKILIRKKSLDFYFNETLGDFPWRAGDYKWFVGTLKSLMPEKYSGYSIGEIYSRKDRLKSLVMPEVTSDGRPFSSRFRVREPEGVFVTHISGRKYPKGLSGKNIALWQSHGRYYEQTLQRWEWQRPCLFGTVEDMMSAGFVLQYLVPMIENAGGYVMLPRERDPNPVEIIIDNDSLSRRTGRYIGTYTETGQWTDGSAGFADTSEVYSGYTNPFRLGTARTAGMAASAGHKASASARWTPDIPERDEYAVYVSYASSPSSTKSACYTVRHAGGTDRFVVNQRMGGGTWVYLGTFVFDKGQEGYVSLDNAVPKGWKNESGRTVSADAVKFGGGMGNIARRDESDSCAVWETSGMPRYAEAARYWLQWAGADSSLFSQNECLNDYKDDFMCRGDWVGYLTGGTSLNPEEDGKGIPVDLAFAFHSDAGVTPNDSLIGTLAIYTHYSEGKSRYPSGAERLAGREYADIVQSQVVNDLRTTFTPEWNRRSIWDRQYREARTPTVPAMLLETFSHQNFADMKYALDPAFRFTVARSVYKGMLKFLSNRYGSEYRVQPLPVNSFAVSFGSGNEAVLSWKPTPDPLEETAAPTGYILYTRMDDGAFDGGREISASPDGGGYSATVPITPGHIYSFRIAAVNDGGRSFPSETLSIGMPEDGCTDDYILIVNNFTRVSPPSWFDTPQYAGFMGVEDRGVPYIRDISYVGDMYEYRRDMPWLDDDNPGFGASWQDYAGRIVAGNTFDYPFIHGKAMLACGKAFCSTSQEAFASARGLWENASAIDIICGKQRAFRGRAVFPGEMQHAIEDAAEAGCNLIVSGAYIGSGIWNSPAVADSTFRAGSVGFAEQTLGYTWRTGFGGRAGVVKPVRSLGGTVLPAVDFATVPNEYIYCVEAPDGIEPASSDSRTIMRYTDTGVSAAVSYESDSHKSVCFGFPLETVSDRETLEAIIKTILNYFEL